MNAKKKKPFHGRYSFQWQSKLLWPHIEMKITNWKPSGMRMSNQCIIGMSNEKCKFCSSLLISNSLNEFFHFDSLFSVSASWESMKFHSPFGITAHIGLQVRIILTKSEKKINEFKSTALFAPFKCNIALHNKHVQCEKWATQFSERAHAVLIE